MVGGTPSGLKRRDGASWAWTLVDIGYKRVHSKLVPNTWEYFLPHLETVPAISVSVNTSYGKRGYHSILSFVGRQMELPECNTFRIPRCDVFFTVIFARSIGIIQRRAKSCASTDLPCVLVTLPVLVVCDVLIARAMAETCTLFTRKLPRLSSSDMLAWGTDE